MRFLKFLLTSLLVTYYVKCERDIVQLIVQNDSAIDYFNWRYSNNISGSGIKQYCEFVLKNNATTFPYLDDIINQPCNDTPDVKSCCYCYAYSDYLNSWNIVELEDFHWTRIDLQCPLSFPIKNNLNYYTLKKRFSKNSSSIYDDNDYITELCIRNKKLKNSTTKHLTEVQMFCDLYWFYEYEVRHIFHVQYLHLFFVTLENVTFEIRNVFGQNSWTAFLNQK